MEIKDKYKKIFIKSLDIDQKKFNDNIKYNEIPEWDSIAHMTLISSLEEGFKISIETDDVITEFKIENLDRPNKAIIYPFSFLLIFIFGYNNYRRKLE